MGHGTYFCITEMMHMMLQYVEVSTARKEKWKQSAQTGRVRVQGGVGSPVYTDVV